MRYLQTLQRQIGNQSVVQLVAARVVATEDAVSVRSADDVRMLTDDQLNIEHAEVRRWLTASANKSSPAYQARAAYMEVLEAVVRERNPQVAERQGRHEVLNQFSRGFSPKASPTAMLAASAFATEVGYGVRERLDQLPLERRLKGVTRFFTMASGEQFEFGIGVAKGIGLGFVDDVKGIFELLMLPYRINKWLNDALFRNLANGKLQARCAAIADKLYQAAHEAQSEILQMFASGKGVDGIYDRLMSSGLDQVNRWGQQAADDLLESLEGPFSQVGEKVGLAVWFIASNIVLAIATDAIGNVIKEGAALAAKLAGPLRRGLAAVAELLPRVRGALAMLAEGLLKGLRKTLAKLEDAVELLRTLVAESLAERELATANGAPIASASAREAKNSPHFSVRTPEERARALDDLYDRGGGGRGRGSQFTSEEVAEEFASHEGMAHDAPLDKKLEQANDIKTQPATKRRAGVAEPPEHHAMPREHEAWFKERLGSEEDIHDFVVTIDEAVHQAIHGGGDFKLARKHWKQGEWNSMIMRELEAAEGAKGSRLNRKEIESIVSKKLLQYGIKPEFKRYSRAAPK